MSLSAIGASQAIQQAVAALQASVESQQAVASVIQQAVDNGKLLSATGNLGTNVDISV
jgi:hypothetical protein